MPMQLSFIGISICDTKVSVSISSSFVLFCRTTHCFCIFLLTIIFENDDIEHRTSGTDTAIMVRRPDDLNYAKVCFAGKIVVCLVLCCCGGVVLVVFFVLVDVICIICRCLILWFFSVLHIDTFARVRLSAAQPSNRRRPRKRSFHCLRLFHAFVFVCCLCF